MDQMTETTAEAAPKTEGGRLSLPVELSLRILAADVDYQDVVALDADHVIDLDCPIEEVEVEVLAAGQRIATGRFVTVDGCLAVQIGAMDPEAAGGT